MICVLLFIQNLRSFQENATIMPHPEVQLKEFYAIYNRLQQLRRRKLDMLQNEVIINQLYCVVFENSFCKGNSWMNILGVKKYIFH